MKEPRELSQQGGTLCCAVHPNMGVQCTAKISLLSTFHARIVHDTRRMGWVNRVEYLFPNYHSRSLEKTYKMTAYVDYKPTHAIIPLLSWNALLFFLNT